MPDLPAPPSGSPAAIDMRSPAFRDDPHPLMRSVREAGRVSRDVVGVWLLCHHADVSSGLRSTRLSREPWRSPVYRQLRPFVADSTLERTAEQWMLFNDPPKHTRLRRLVNGAFKPPVVAALRERIVAVADELLDELPREGNFDLMSGFAQQLPVRVICDVLGLPAQDFAKTKLWSDALALIVEPVVRREVHLINHSHLDIGYTDVHARVLDKHWRGLDSAMVYSERSRANPDWGRFRWNVEGLWPLEGYLAARPAADTARLLAAVRNGDLTLNALYANLMTGLSGSEELLRLTE